MKFPVLRNSRRAMTLVEVVTAGALSVIVSASLLGLIIMAQRTLKPEFSQQMHTKYAKTAVEQISNAIRGASVSSIQVYNDAGAIATTGNRVDFANPGEANGRRRIRLNNGADNNAATPWDNTLTIDFDTSTASTVDVTIPWVTQTTFNNAIAPLFTWTNAFNPLSVRLRVGDPTGNNTSATVVNPDGGGNYNNAALCDARTGRGLQGVDVTISVAPRN